MKIAEFDFVPQPRCRWCRYCVIGSTYVLRKTVWQRLDFTSERYGASLQVTTSNGVLREVPVPMGILLLPQPCETLCLVLAKLIEKIKRYRTPADVPESVIAELCD